MKSVTLRHIAKRTGLSVAAVSKSLRGHADIAPATRERVRQIAQELGYVMHTAARSLIMQRAMAVGVVLPFAHIPTVTERLRGIQAAALERQYLTMVAFHTGDAEEERRQIEMLYGRVDGLILTPANQKRELGDLLRRMRLPVVCMSEPLTGMETDFVGDDDCEGGRLAAAHLLQNGCCRLAYLGNDPSIPSDAAMLEGLGNALRRRHLRPLDPASVRWGNQNAGDTRRNVDALLDASSPPDGMLVFSDMAAMWALQRLEARGVKVPSEMSLVAYDNSAFAELARVPLTSVAQPNFEIGQHAMHLLLDRLASDTASTPCRRIAYRPTLVVRKSSQA
ncbi:MAG: LacI family DNA-binding transcriptional regulator [Kiritimatiellae bacterium]|nr:LacI family DNA-binding transcriptional regulator [Kiritimatiellia bacterium]